MDDFFSLRPCFSVVRFKLFILIIIAIEEVSFKLYKFGWRYLQYFDKECNFDFHNGKHSALSCLGSFVEVYNEINYLLVLQIKIHFFELKLFDLYYRSITVNTRLE